MLARLIRVADKGDAEDRDVALSQGFDRQQAVIDRSQCRARHDHSVEVPPREDIGEEHGIAQRDEQPAGALDHDPAVAMGRFQQRKAIADLNTLVAFLPTKLFVMAYPIKRF